MPKPTKDYLY